MSSSRIIPLSTFLNYLSSGDRSLLPQKNTEFYKIEEFSKIDFPIHPKISELKEFNFDKGIEFKDCQFQNGLKFLNCKGRTGIKFIDCTAPELNPQDPKPSIEFQNFTFDHLTIEVCNLPGGVFFNQFGKRQEPTNILSSLKISNSSFNQGGICLEDVKFNHGFEFNYIKDCGPIKIKDIETTDECKILQVNAYSLKVTGDKLKIGGGLKVTRSSFPIAFFERGQIDGDLKFYEVGIQGQMSFLGCSINGRTLISPNPEMPLKKEKKTSFKTFIPSLFFHSSDFNEGFILDGGGKVVKEISLDFSPLLKGRMVFSNANINKVELRGTNSENNLYFRNLGFKEILLNDFLNLKSVSFSNLNSAYTASRNAVFKVLDSDLGSWELANFDFDSFDKIIWRDSQISGLQTSAVSWFKDSKLEAEGENDPATCFRRREFYRQLKQASEKQGDRINELEFKRREIKAYRKGLKIRQENHWDRFTIWTGGSNNHGQNWVKPLLFILGISTFLFPFLFILADKEIELMPSWTTEGWDRFWLKVSEHGTVWVQLFNLTRSLGDLFSKPIENPFWVYFLDGLHRILLAFFIFQIVSAFRKFVK